MIRKIVELFYVFSQKHLTNNTICGISISGFLVEVAVIKSRVQIDSKGVIAEVGKRRLDILEDYLERHSHEMHRTTLRYAIEKMSARQRQWWMAKDRKS